MMPVNHDGPGPEARRTRRLIWTGVVLVIIGVLPLLSVWLTYTIANAADCEVNEAFVVPCVIAGVDVGGVLNTMGVLGWLMLVSLPIGAVGLAVLLVGIVQALAGRRASR